MWADSEGVELETVWKGASRVCARRAQTRPWVITGWPPGVVINPQRAMHRLSGDVPAQRQMKQAVDHTRRAPRWIRSNQLEVRYAL